MNTELRLDLDQKIIELANNYAKEQKTSLSKIIEKYLISIIKNKAQKGQISEDSIFYMSSKALSNFLKQENESIF